MTLEGITVYYSFAKEIDASNLLLPVVAINLPLLKILEEFLYSKSSYSSNQEFPLRCRPAQRSNLYLSRSLHLSVGIDRTPRRAVLPRPRSPSKRAADRERRWRSFDPGRRTKRLQVPRKGLLLLTLAKEMLTHFGECAAEPNRQPRTLPCVWPILFPVEHVVPLLRLELPEESDHPLVLTVEFATFLVGLAPLRFRPEILTLLAFDPTVSSVVQHILLPSSFGSI